VRANRSDQELLFRPLQQVIVLDDPADRLDVDEALLRRGLVRVLEHVQLQLRGAHGGEAALLGASQLVAQHAARRQRHQLMLLGAVDVAEHQRRLVLPRGHAHRLEVRDRMEVAVPLRPTGEGVARHRIHVHVARQQVIAGVHPLLRHLVEEEGGRDSLPHQAPVHVGEGHHHRFHIAVRDQPLQIVEIDPTLHIRPSDKWKMEN